MSGTSPRAPVGPAPSLPELKALGVLRLSQDGQSILRPDDTVFASKVAAPTIAPAGGAFGAQNVTLATTTAGADIYYTTDGSYPTTASTHYTVPFAAATSTIKAIAVLAGSLTSDMTAADFVINGQVATPTFNPAAGAVALNTPVTITSSTAGAAIHYTIDGSAPTVASPLYAAPVVVSALETIKAIAFKAAYTDSAVGSAAYTIAP